MHGLSRLGQPVAQLGLERGVAQAAGLLVDRAGDGPHGGVVAGQPGRLGAGRGDRPGPLQLPQLHRELPRLPQQLVAARLAPAHPHPPKHRQRPVTHQWGVVQPPPRRPNGVVPGRPWPA